MLRRQAAHGAATASSAGHVAALVPATAEWDEAFLRVESYLRAHHIESRVLLNKLTAEIVDAARAVAVMQPDESAVTLAMQVAHARIGEWMVEALGEGDWTDGHFRARGRLALLLADVPGRCPERFLSLQDLAPEVARAMRAGQLEPGPELRLSRMPSAPLEFPRVDSVGETWVTFSRSAFVRGATSWLLIAGVVGLAWVFTR